MPELICAICSLRLFIVLSIESKSVPRSRSFWLSSPIEESACARAAFAAAIAAASPSFFIPYGSSSLSIFSSSSLSSCRLSGVVSGLKSSSSAEM